MTDVMADRPASMQAPGEESIMHRIILFLALGVLFAAPLFAHCDSVKGPVVADAQKALASRDVTPLLKWVPVSAEAEVREAFLRTLAVRGESDAARELADRWFFETVVRIHRASEGEPFTGLKASELPVEEGIEMADVAVESGSLEKVEAALLAEVSAGLRRRFAEVKEARKHSAHNVAAGRHFVESYVSFIHYVERLHQSATASSAHGVKHEDH
jgi:hypothetical protein